MREIVVIAHDMRSTHNVGALLRTAECLGMAKVYLTGYTPYPLAEPDGRLPHIARKLDVQIHKTALGAEQLVPWEHASDALPLVAKLKTEGFMVVALEQAPNSVDISSWMPSDKIAILLGREIEGIDQKLLKTCDMVVEIPQFGKKESLNVVQAAAIALFRARFAS